MPSPEKTENFGVLYFCGAAIATVAEDPADPRAPHGRGGPPSESLARGSEDALLSRVFAVENLWFS
jgi:hypothetical protein